MKGNRKFLLTMGLTSLAVLNLNVQVDAKEGTSKDKSPKIQNIEVDHRNYDKKASKVKEEATKSSSAAMDYINSLEGKGWDFDGAYGLTIA
ncbi:hypothetical protein [Mammaliicoccus lentus]|uniref:hypothetical protein n=1 Tax=Mammaliicoccus lentus TaxID=42858 RepID=UPI001B33D84B|nr:hypothetical protein [Mammaliicoccus lentus]